MASNFDEKLNSKQPFIANAVALDHEIKKMTNSSISDSQKKMNSVKDADDSDKVTKKIKRKLNGIPHNESDEGKIVLKKPKRLKILEDSSQEDFKIKKSSKKKKKTDRIEEDDFEPSPKEMKSLVKEEKIILKKFSKLKNSPTIVHDRSSDGNSKSETLAKHNAQDSEKSVVKKKSSKLTKSTTKTDKLEKNCNSEKCKSNSSFHKAGKVKKEASFKNDSNANRGTSSQKDKKMKEEDSLKESVKIKKELSVNVNRTTKKETPENKSKKIKKEPALKKAGKKTPNKNSVKAENKKKEDETEVWKWWEEKPHPDGVKWLSLEHKGPYFPPEYVPLPDSVNFYYDGKKYKLSLLSEEVAGFYAKMLDHDYTKKALFNNNFFADWKDVMTREEKKTIKDFSKCNFREMCDYFAKLSEEKKALPKEEKLKIKEENNQIVEDYGYCMMDGHKQKVGNFRIEPPGLFRGRGDHPKQGKLKNRVKPSDIIINIGKDAKVPDPPFDKWKAIYHDNTVTWLACWIENISGSHKYVLLNPTSRVKGQKDMEKFNIARELRKHIDRIRKGYNVDLTSKEMMIRQRATALYFIDKLALRAGHEKDADEAADTVGCCSLRVEHIKLHLKYEELDFVVEFDFLGKDSIRYNNYVAVERQVYKNLKLFMENKDPGDDLFDRLSTSSLNKYLNDLMENLTAKVFRTFNASNTLQNQLDELTKEESNVNEKILAYNRANRAVAILCNHQRAVPKTFNKTMENMQAKLLAKENEIKELKKEIKKLKKDKVEKSLEIKQRKLGRQEEQYRKLELSITDKDENKDIALGTSKLNYLDPRISVSWCLKNNVPIEKIYNKTQREKFQWAIDMTDDSFRF